MAAQNGIIYKKKRGGLEIIRDDFEMDMASSSHEPQRLPKKRKLVSTEEEKTSSVPPTENANDPTAMLTDP